MVLEDFLRYVKELNGVLDAFIPDDSTMESIFALESNVEDTSFGTPMDNRALAESKKRLKHIIVFCNYAFSVPTDHVMVMEDADGCIVGFDIPPGKQEEYIDRTDLVWLSDDFVLVMNGKDMAKVVMLPQKLDFVNGKYDVDNAILFYPVTTTDIFLKEKFKMDKSSPSIASAVLSFDVV